MKPQKNPFTIDDRIVSTCFELGDWPLCRVYLKNNAQYPWFILVPRIEGIQEIDEMSEESRHQLINEMSKLASIIRTHFKPDKLNVAYLGNMISQLHIHLVARFRNDKLWPHGIWQAAQENSPYTDEVLKILLSELGRQIC